MTTIAAGVSDSVTLAQGSTLKTTGTGTAVLGPGPQANMQIGIQGANAIGPFPRDQVIYISATTAVEYMVTTNNTAAPVARLSTDAANNFAGLLGPTGTVFSLLSAPRVRTCVLGDSITWYGLDSGTLSGKPFSAITSRSWYDYANALLGQKLNILNRAGVSGNRLDQMRDRFDANVASYKPNFVILEGGSNDLDQGYSADQIFAVLMQIYSKCRSIGATMLYVGTAGMSRANSGAPVSPVDGVQYSLNVEFAKLYTYARRASGALQGFMYFDMAAAMRDYSGTTTSTAQGAVLPGTSADGTHPTPYGCYLMGASLASFLSGPLAMAPPDRASLNGYGANGDQSVLIGNHLLIGSTGGVGGMTGTMPDSYSLSKSGSMVATGFATAARTDGGPGKKLVLPLSGAAAVTDYVQIAASSAYSKGAGLAAWLQAAAKVVSATTGSVLQITGNLQFLDSGSGLLGQVFFGRAHQAQSADTLTGLAGTPDFGLQRTTAMNVPAGTATVAVYIKIYTTVGAQLTVELCDLDARVDNVGAMIATFL